MTDKRGKAHPTEVTTLDWIERNQRLQTELFQARETIKEQALRLHSLEEKYAEACRQLDSVTGNLQELTEATTMRGDGGHSRRCVQCDHWAVVEKCGICGAEEATDGAGISVEARLAKDLYSQGCRLGEALKFAAYIAKRYEEGWDEPVTERFYSEAKQLLSAVERRAPDLVDAFKTLAELDPCARGLHDWIGSPDATRYCSRCNLALG